MVRGNCIVPIENATAAGWKDLKTFQAEIIPDTPTPPPKTINHGLFREIDRTSDFTAGIFCRSHSTGHNYRSLNISPKTV